MFDLRRYFLFIFFFLLKSLDEKTLKDFCNPASAGKSPGAANPLRALAAALHVPALLSQRDSLMGCPTSSPLLFPALLVLKCGSQPGTGIRVLEMESRPAGAGHRLVAHLRFATDPWRCRKGALPVVPPKHDPPPLRVAARSWGHDAGCPVSGWRAMQGTDLRGMLRSARRAAQGRLSAPSRGSASAAPCTKRDEIQRYLQARGEVTVQKGPSAVPEEIPSIWFNRALVNVEVFLSQCSL